MTRLTERLTALHTSLLDAVSGYREASRTRTARG